MKVKFFQGLIHAFLMLSITSCITVSVGSYPPLFKASESGDIAVAEKLIKNCEAINQISIGAQTPLHLAAASGQDKMVVWLLAHEADPLAKDQNGKTPYDFAIDQMQVNSATIIKNYARTRNDENDVYKAGRLQLLDTLLHIDDYRKLDLLHYFAEVGDVINLTQQIQKTKNIDITTAAGKTPLHFAVIAGQINSVEFLIETDANPNIGDMYNKTPLYYAVEKSNITAIKLLLNADADPLIPSYCNKMNSLELAKSMNSQEIIDLLQGKK